MPSWDGLEHPGRAHLRPATHALPGPRVGPVHSAHPITDGRRTVFIFFFNLMLSETPLGHPLWPAAPAADGAAAAASRDRPGRADAQLATATREWSTRELLRAVAATENAGRLDAALLARAAFSLAPATAMRGRVEGKDEV